MIAKRKPKPPAKRANAGRPPHEPTAAGRSQVETLSGYGLSHASIATFIGVARQTLENHYQTELDMGACKANTKVAAAQFARATQVNHPQGVAAGIWWEKTRSGMREPKQELAHSGAIGTFDLSKLTDAELTTLEPILARLALAGGSSGGDSEAGG